MTEQEMREKRYEDRKAVRDRLQSRKRCTVCGTQDARTLAGKWKHINNRCDGYAWQICSECSEKGKSTWNFCRNCGADMRPSANDEKEV